MLRPLRLLIVQPYLPNYRVPFFEQLIPRLSADGIDCRVAIPADQVHQRDRGDSAEAQWTFHGDARSCRFAGRLFSNYGSAPARRGADAVIAGLAATSLDTWAVLAQSLTRRLPVGLWGHVRHFVNPPNNLSGRLKQYQALHADHLFTYTPQGEEEARKWGIPADKISCVMNTADMGPVRTAIRQLTDSEITAFQAKCGLVPGKTTAFIGAIDGSKRIPFLAEALDYIWRDDPTFRMLLGGAGALHCLLERAVSRGQVIDMGIVNATDKALMAATASTICMPGRIGLVAVDSLAMGMPIVTTDWEYHAPEVAYLSEGSSRFTSSQGPASFAKLLVSETARQALVRPTFDAPEMSDMVERFQRGVLTLVAAG